MRYRVQELMPRIIKIDVLIFCHYSLYIMEQVSRNDRLTIGVLIKYLTYYDFNYASINPQLLKFEIIKLFPIRKNNHKHTKYFKFNKTLVNYWGEKFNINYEIHQESYSVFKRISDEKKMSF